MIVTDAERLILLMLSDLHDSAGIDKINTRLLRSAISTNNTWAINWEIPDLGVELSDTPQEVVDVANYMFMWSILEDTWHYFPENIKERISENVQINKTLRFPGFHSTAEKRLYGIAKLFVDDMGRFERHKGRDLNSHTPMEEQYKKMYSTFERFVAPDDFSPTLTPENFIDIFKATAA